MYTDEPDAAMPSPQTSLPVSVSTVSASHCACAVLAAPQTSAMVKRARVPRFAGTAVGLPGTNLEIEPFVIFVVLQATCRSVPAASPSYQDLAAAGPTTSTSDAARRPSASR